MFKDGKRIVIGFQDHLIRKMVDRANRLSPAERIKKWANPDRASEPLDTSSSSSSSPKSLLMPMSGAMVLSASLS